MEFSCFEMLEDNEIAAMTALERGERREAIVERLAEIKAELYALAYGSVERLRLEEEYEDERRRLHSELSRLH